MMNYLSFEWKKDNYVSIIGTIDENADFSTLFKKNIRVLFLDFKGVVRINSNGVRLWINAIEHLKDVELHYINCSFAVVDQLSMIPEFLTEKTFIESFDARYICENCNESYTVTLVVGYDIQPGLQQYLDGPERLCPTCNRKLEFDHNPDSYLFFLSNLRSIKK